MPRETWNLNNFARLKKRIQDNPLAFDMYSWGDEDGHSPCGTVGCIAGTCDMMMNQDGMNPVGRQGYGDKPPMFIFQRDGKLTPETVKIIKDYGTFDLGNVAISNAMTFLGIDRSEASNLFFPDEWPTDFYEELEDIHFDMDADVISVEDGRRKMVNLTIERIDLFLREGV